MIVLPIDSTKDSTVFVDIGTDTFGFYTHWNVRNASWFLDILEDDGTPINQCLRIANHGILNRFCGARIPGTLFALSMDDNDLSDPGEFDLGTRILIMYEETAE